MDDVLALVIPQLAAIIFVFVVLAWDETRMTNEMRDRAWPTASRRIAAVYFTPFALPIHFLRTRRSWRGLLLGLAWGTALLVADEALADGLDVFVHHPACPE